MNLEIKKKKRNKILDDIAELNNNIIDESNMNIDNNNQDLNNNIDKINTSNKNEENFNIINEEKIPKKKEITKDFSDIDEIEGETIQHDKNRNLTAIDLNLLLKYISLSDYLKNIISKIYHFTQQCFSFIDKEILFPKIKSCYEYFKEKSIPLEVTKYLVYFFNILILEMYEYYTKIPFGDKALKVIISLLKQIEEDLYETIRKSILEKNKSNKDNYIPMKTAAMNEKIKFFETKKEKKPSLNEDDENEEDNKDGKNEDNIIIKELTLDDLLKETRKIISFCEKGKCESEIILKKLIKNSCFCKYKCLTKNEDPNYKKENIIKIDNLRRRTSLNKQEKLIKDINEQPWFSVNDWEPNEIGDVLIKITLGLFKKIKLRELYRSVYIKEKKNETSPNVINCINATNNLSSFIINEILSYDLPKDRARQFEGWIKVADYLRTKNDYNDLFAIYIALNHFSIQRLELTQKEINSRAKNIFTQLEDLFSLDNNNQKLRQEITKHIEKNEFHIPYLGIHLRDITSLEGVGYITDLNLINFNIIEKVHLTIKILFQYTKMEDPNENITTYRELNFFNNLEENKVDPIEISNKLEPEFTLYENPKKEKRKTIIDLKYFNVNIDDNNHYINNLIEKEKI